MGPEIDLDQNVTWPVKPSPSRIAKLPCPAVYYSRAHHPPMHPLQHSWTTSDAQPTPMPYNCALCVAHSCSIKEGVYHMKLNNIVSIIHRVFVSSIHRVFLISSNGVVYLDWLSGAPHCISWPANGCSSYTHISYHDNKKSKQNS